MRFILGSRDTRRAPCQILSTYPLIRDRDSSRILILNFFSHKLQSKLPLPQNYAFDLMFIQFLILLIGFYMCNMKYIYINLYSYMPNPPYHSSNFSVICLTKIQLASGSTTAILNLDNIQHKPVITPQNKRQIKEPNLQIAENIQKWALKN